MARTYTVEECTELFINTLAEAVTANANAPGLTALQRCQGLALDIVEMIGGENPDLPLWILAPHPNPEAVAFHLAVPQDWWPVGELEVGEDIAPLVVVAYTETL